MTGIALALSASLAWGCADFLGGLTSRRLATLTVLFSSQAVALTLFTVLIVGRGGSPGDPGFVGYSLLSGAGEAVGLAAFYRGLAVGAMGVVSPIAASAAIVPVSVGVAVGEAPGPLEALGIALTLAGMLLVAYEPADGQARARRVAAGAGLAVLAALGFGTFFVCIDAASERTDVLWAIFVNRLTLVVLVGAAVAITRPSLRVGTRFVAPLAAIGVLDIGASTLFATATTEGLLTIVGVLGALYPVTTVLLGRLVLGEHLRALQRVGTAVALSGVAIIST